jgi:hypothetical protein
MSTQHDDLPELPEALRDAAAEEAIRNHPFPPALDAAFDRHLERHGPDAADAWLRTRVQGDPALRDILIQQELETRVREALLQRVLAGTLTYNAERGTFRAVRRDEQP